MTNPEKNTDPPDTSPVGKPHALDEMCRGGECDTCRQNIAIDTLNELRTIRRGQDQLLGLLSAFASSPFLKLGRIIGKSS